VWFWLMSCGEQASFLDRPAADPPERPGVAAPPSGLSLARPNVAATFTLPASNSHDGQPAPAEVRLSGTFQLEVRRQYADLYTVPLPIPRHLLPTEQDGTHNFGSRPPHGLVIRGPNGVVPFERKGRLPGTWGYDADQLFMGVSPGGPPPDAASFVLSFPKATETENRMSFATSGLSAEAFARRTLTIGPDSYTGLYLPPPAEARFPLIVPAEGRLAFTPRLLPPSMPAAAASDGAHVAVAVVAAGQETVAFELEVDGIGTEEVVVDLSRWGGQAVELVIRTSPRGSPALDYLLLASPRVFAPRSEPERIVVVFVDTLRPDHLGFAGYTARPTSPTLDRLAKHATVFSDARSVAPWTLPSTRALLTGREPEEWSRSASLPEVLGAAGFYSEAIVTNAFLSPPFDVHRGWDRFHYDLQLPAPEVVARAVASLEAHREEDQLLLVHFMEPHLPYDDPTGVRSGWAGDLPDGLEEINRATLTRIRTDHPSFAEIRQYVTERYDGEIAALDEALAPLFAAAGPRATVILVSDHGEELWDHDGFEHGHTFYDELLRVPLVIRSPALPPGTRTEPVSLLDLVPTVCELAGAQCPEVDGTSLVPLAWGDGPAIERMRARTLSFGRPLYGEDGWGVVSGGRKWWDRAGEQVVYDLAQDRGEHTDLARSDPALTEYPGRLAAALGREVRVAWRIDIDAPPDWHYDLGLYASHPGGLAEAWVGFDPRGRIADIPPVVREGRVQLEVPAEHEFPRTLWVVPVGDPYDIQGLVVSLTGRGVALLGAATGQRPPSYDPAPILTTAGSQFRMTVRLGYVPTPSGGEVTGYSPEMEAELRALGYLDDAD
jgi:arylsulfatase A-like enzyme